ncbi:hypothetical protein BpHYR1_029836 [Brachionus plicatilis]|uniref:Uncharacterized protein n=1 Tax=Brachionus plicatilis TaxID=10195 RepID=A0A3M7PZU2_BRAPC|nr:hypothetical protein BpHYR1_029836 [Brachionus plicatilis]
MALRNRTPSAILILNDLKGKSENAEILHTYYKRNPFDQDTLRNLKSNGTSDLLNISRAQFTHINIFLSKAIDKKPLIYEFLEILKISLGHRTSGNQYQKKLTRRAKICPKYYDLPKNNGGRRNVEKHTHN